MEKQKIFWVVLSVSIFVVIVLVVGVYLLRQKPTVVSTPPGAINPISGPGPGAQVYEYSGPSGTGAQQPGGPQTMHFYIGEGAPQAPAQQPPAQQPTQPPPGPAVQPQAPVQPPVQAAQPATPPIHPRVTAAVPRQAPPAKTVERPRPPRRVVDYWIQTGSYKSQSKADELVSTLADKGLPGKVFSYDARGTTFYRVRIGPYVSQGEANKFLSIVRQIQGLESSYISQVGGIRNLN